jgi:hypothetical protein
MKYFGGQTMYFRVALVLCCLFLQFCSHDEITVSLCSIDYFTQADPENFIEIMEQPIVVRNVRGKITNTIGGWPKDCPILFELRRIGNGAKTIQAYADGEGDFEILRIPKGHYCFKATVDG